MIDLAVKLVVKLLRLGSDLIREIVATSLIISKLHDQRSQMHNLGGPSISPLICLSNCFNLLLEPPFGDHNLFQESPNVERGGLVLQFNADLVVRSLFPAISRTSSLLFMGSFVNASSKMAASIT